MFDAAMIDPATITKRFWSKEVKGDCMEPAFVEGDMAVFDREAAIKAGDYVCLFFHPKHVTPGHPNYRLKRVVEVAPSFVSYPYDGPQTQEWPVIVTECLNPPERVDVPCSCLLAVHKCLGRADNPEVQEVLEAER